MYEEGKLHCAPQIAFSVYLEELGELLFSIVLSQGPMVHVLIHVLC